MWKPYVLSTDKNIQTKREYEVRVLERSEFARWDEFVRRSPQGTLFHTTLWLEAADVPFRLYGYFLDGKLHGGFAIGLVGHRIAGRPHPHLTPYFGILYPASEAKYVTEISRNREIGSAFAVALKSEFDFIDISFSPEVFDLLPFMWEGFTIRVGYTYRLALADLKSVFDNMEARRRNKLVSAQREGMRVEVGADFTEVMRLSEKSFERQGLLASNRSAALRFEATLRREGRCMGFLARDKEGEPLGAVWIAWDNKRAYYLVGGYDHSTKSNKGVSLALWHAIQFSAVDLKLAEFDFEGSIIPAVEQFFRKFGGRLTPYYRVHYQRDTGNPSHNGDWRAFTKYFGVRRIIRKVTGIIGS